MYFEYNKIVENLHLTVITDILPQTKTIKIKYKV